MKTRRSKKPKANSEPPLPPKLPSLFGSVDGWIGLGNAKSAAEELGRLQIKNQNDFVYPSLILWIEIAVIEGDWSTVADRCFKFITICQDSPLQKTAYLRWAEALRKKGEDAQADRLLEQGGRSFAEMAARLFAEEKWAEAKTWLQAGIRLYPPLKDSHPEILAYGELFLDPPPVEEVQAEQFNPFLEVQQALARGSWESATKALEQVDQEWKDNFPRMAGLLGLQILAKKGDEWPAVERKSRELIRRFDWEKGGYKLLVEALLAQGRAEEAEDFRSQAADDLDGLVDDYLQMAAGCLRSSIELRPGSISDPLLQMLLERPGYY